MLTQRRKMNIILLLILKPHFDNGHGHYCNMEIDFYRVTRISTKKWTRYIFAVGLGIIWKATLVRKLCIVSCAHGNLYTRSNPSGKGVNQYQFSAFGSVKSCLPFTRSNLSTHRHDPPWYHRFPKFGRTYPR